MRAVLGLCGPLLKSRVNFFFLADALTLGSSRARPPTRPHFTDRCETSQGGRGRRVASARALSEIKKRKMPPVRIELTTSSLRRTRYYH